MTGKDKTIIGFVVVCQCGVTTGLMRYQPTKNDVVEIPAKWLNAGCEIKPRFGLSHSRDWEEEIGVCECNI